MSNYILYTGGPYKQRTGSAITATSTDINGGSAKAMAKSETLGRSEFHRGNYKNRSYSGVPGVLSVQYNYLSVQTVSDGQISGLVLLQSDDPMGLNPGDYVYIVWPVEINHNGKISDTYKVISNYLNGAGGTQIVIDLPTKDIINIGGGSYNNVSLYTFSGTLNNQLAENYIMQKNDGSLAGLPSNILAYGSSDHGRDKVHRINALRTNKVATSIRQGKYHVVSGVWLTTPSVSNDYTLMDNDGTNIPDDEAKSISNNRGVGGEIAYRQQRSAVTGEYDRRTT